MFNNKNKATDSTTYEFQQIRNKLTIEEIKMQSPKKQIYFPVTHVNQNKSQSIDASRKGRYDTQSINRAQTVNCVKDYVIKQPKKGKQLIISQKEKKRKAQIEEIQRNILQEGVKSYEIKDSFNNIVINYAPNFTTISPKNVQYKPHETSNNQKYTSQEIWQKYQNQKQQSQNNEYKSLEARKYIEPPKNQRILKNRVPEYSQTLDELDFEDIKYNKDQIFVGKKQNNNKQQQTLENIKNCIEKFKINQQPENNSERQNRHIRDLKNMQANRTMDNRAPVEIHPTHKRKNPPQQEKVQEKMPRNQYITKVGLNILNRFIQRKKGLSFLINLIKYTQK